MTMVVFRSLAQLPMEALWSFSPNKMSEIAAGDVLLGAALGLLGSLAGMAFIFGHWKLMEAMDYFALLDNRVAIRRALVGATAITVIGIFIPHTMFWSEEEIQQIATGAASKDLGHVFPTRGITGFEMDSAFRCFLTGVAKLLAISFSVAGGYRGGFIFPMFSVGCAFGRALVYIFPSVNLSIACLCLAAGVNVTVTKTSLSTPLVLAFCAGEQYAFPAILTASIVSLLATAYTPFIKTQVEREDIAQSSARRRHRTETIRDDEACLFSSLKVDHRPAERRTLFLDEPEPEEPPLDAGSAFSRNNSIETLRATFTARVPIDLSDPALDSEHLRSVLKPTMGHLTERGFLG